jgi:hypothetical protein
MLNVRELNDDLDVIGFSVQCLFEVLRFFPPGNQARQPLPIRTGQRFAGLEPVFTWFFIIVSILRFSTCSGPSGIDVLPNAIVGYAHTVTTALLSFLPR